MSIAEAIADLKNELIAGTDTNVAIALIAHDYGLRPVFLENRAIVALGDLGTVAERHRAAVQANAGNVEQAKKRMALTRIKERIHAHNNGIQRVSTEELEMLCAAANQLGANYRVTHRRERRPNFDRDLMRFFRELMG